MSDGEKRVAVITGAARGIGQVVAARMHAQGYRVGAGAGSPERTPGWSTGSGGRARFRSARR